MAFSSNEIRRSLQSVESTSSTIKWVISGSIVAIIALILFWLFATGSNETTFRTVKAKTGTLTVAITATGTLEPITQVTVGTEISGTVQQVYVEENDRVKKGQLLLRLNTDRLEAEYSQSFSSVKSAEAGLVEATATREEASENLKKLEELYRLSKGLTPSNQELMAARSTLNRAVAKENSAKASIKEAKARLSVTEINLKKSEIVAPINGIVLSRKIEPGQTVAASFSTPELFIIAENLTQLALKAEVDEADIGRVKVGQVATFTVDAFPDRTFDAKITRVRFAPTTTTSGTEAVVTYQTTLTVNNNDLVLRPGMTATAEIIVEKLTDALLVPNIALRFSPPVEEPKASLLSSIMPGPRFRRPQQNQKGGDKQVWIIKDNQPSPIPIKTGSTDGNNTVVIEGNIKPGTELITEMITPK